MRLVDRVDRESKHAIQIFQSSAIQSKCLYGRQKTSTHAVYICFLHERENLYHYPPPFSLLFHKILFLNACFILIVPFRCRLQYKLFVVQNVISLFTMLKKYQQRVKNGIRLVLNVVRCRFHAILFLSLIDYSWPFLSLMIHQNELIFVVCSKNRPV